VAIGFTALCTAFFRWSRTGLVLRAGTDNERGVLLLGWSPKRSAVVAWTLAALLASGAAIVLASFASIAPDQFGVYTVPALGAALAGRFRNLWIVCGVGLGIGALQALAVRLGSLQSLPLTLQSGLDDALPLIVIVVTLSFAGTSLPRRGALLERRFPMAAPAPRAWMLAALTAAALAVAWFGASPLRLSLVQTVITAVLALSMVVSAGYIGQVSLAQVTIAGLAAYLLAGLSAGWHVPFPFAQLLAILGAAGLGFVVGIPALRIRGAQLMVVSLAFVIAVNRLVLQNAQLGRAVYGISIEPPSLFGFDLGTYGPGGFPAPRSVVLIVVVAAASFVAVANLRRSGTGRRWLAVRANEAAAAACGVDVVRMKLLASAVAVGLAGVAGVLIAHNAETVSYRLFDTDLVLALVALAYLGGVASIGGAIVAGLLAAGGLVEQLLEIGSGKQGNSLVYGIPLVLVCVLAPGGLAGIADSVRQRLGRARFAPVHEVGVTSPSGSVAARQRS
jgi:ABC-type branched-subunit amino acid transport system permease subunit